MVFAISGLAVAGCGSEEAADTTSESSATSSSEASGEAFKIAYQDGFTGPMAYDSALTDQGIQTALNQLGNEVLGRPIE